jgi:hypothetical protein
MLGCKDFASGGLVHQQLQRQRCIRVLAATAGGAVKGEGRGGRVRPHWFSWPTKAILRGNQEGPCVQAHAFAAVTTALCTTSFHPPFGEISNSLRASNLA